MSDETDIEEALVRRCARVTTVPSGNYWARTANGFAGWCSFGSTAACKGASTLPT